MQRPACIAATVQEYTISLNAAGTHSHDGLTTFTRSVILVGWKQCVVIAHGELGNIKTGREDDVTRRDPPAVITEAQWYTPLKVLLMLFDLVLLQLVP